MIDLQDMKMSMVEEPQKQFRASTFTNLMNTTTQSENMMPMQKTMQGLPHTTTTSSWFTANKDDNPLDALNAEQLRERLIVAETIMKQ
jgi:hypothetical protein